MPKKESLQQELEKVRQRSAQLRKQKDDYEQKREDVEKRIEQINEDIKQVDGANTQALSEGKRTFSKKTQIEEQLKDLEKEIAGIQSDKSSLLQERERLQKQLSAEARKVQLVQEEIAEKLSAAGELVKRRGEVEVCLLEQQRVYEGLRGDRNAYSKALTETQDELAEGQRRLKIVAQQIEQLKEELCVKEKVLAHENTRTKELLKSAQTLEKKNEILRTRRESRDEDIKTLVNQIGKLRFFKTNIDAELLEVKKNYEISVSQRDLLATELIQKNDETALLHERIAAQEEVLKDGQSEYRKIETEEKLLHLISKNLCRELSIFGDKLKAIVKYKEKIAELNGSIVEEKLKVRALSEELENPLNFHRWRYVGNAELDDYELLNRIQDIQKKLIGTTQDIISKESQVLQNQLLAQNLAELIRGGPGSKEAEDLLLLKKSLREKTRKGKALTAELNLFNFKIFEVEGKVSDLKENIDVNKKRLLQIDSK